MICYRDMTFCNFADKCADAADCPRALTQEVREAAEKWWGKPNPPIAVFGEKLECFREARE